MAWMAVCDTCGVMGGSWPGPDLPENWIQLRSGRLYCDKAECHRRGQRALKRQRPAPETDSDQQACERCEKEHPIETMTMMEDCWFCSTCVGEFEEEFAACAHTWEPHTDTMGDDGQYCSHCTGFARNEDFAALGILAPTHS